MKKYIAPEVEIKRFAVENIMTDGSAVVTPEASVSVSTNTATADVSASVSYSTLFNLN